MRLKEIRKAKNMSQRKLADLSGVSRSNIQKIEKGETKPTVETACNIAMALEVSLCDLVICDGGNHPWKDHPLFTCPQPCSRSGVNCHIFDAPAKHPH